MKFFLTFLCLAVCRCDAAYFFITNFRTTPIDLKITYTYGPVYRLAVPANTTVQVPRVAAIYPGGDGSGGPNAWELTLTMLDSTSGYSDLASTYVGTPDDTKDVYATFYPGYDSPLDKSLQATIPSSGGGGGFDTSDPADNFELFEYGFWFIVGSGFVALLYSLVRSMGRQNFNPS